MLIFRFFNRADTFRDHIEVYLNTSSSLFTLDAESFSIRWEVRTAENLPADLPEGGKFVSKSCEAARIGSCRDSISGTLAIAGGGDSLLIGAIRVPKTAESGVLSGPSASAPVMLRAAYRNELHEDLPKALRQAEHTDLAWLPPCRPVKPIPFRDIWLIGKKELKWLYSRGIGQENNT